MISNGYRPIINTGWLRVGQVVWYNMQTTRILQQFPADEHGMKRYRIITPDKDKRFGEIPWIIVDEIDVRAL